MATHVQPIYSPLLSGIHHSHDAAVGGAESVHELDVFVLDQVHNWGWDDMLFVQCGDGWAAEEAWRRRRTRGHVVALDMSPGAIERARRLRGVAGRVEFATWDGLQLYQTNGTFDQIIASFALKYSPDPEGLARDMLRVLRPGGELYALEPESRSGDARQFLTSAGFSEIAELASSRADGLERVVVIHARCRTIE